MKVNLSILIPLVLIAAPGYAELKTGPQLTLQLVKDWAKLPKGWNFGECSGVAVDKNDNVWVFNRGSHPVIQLDKNGNFLQAWPDVVVKSSHGIRVDNDGNIWGVDVKGHVVIKYNTDGKVLMVLGNRQGTPGNNDSRDAFNEPTGVAFRPDGSFYVSDGYVNSRVVLFNKDGEYIKHWGKKGTGDGEFDLSHDVALDGKGRVYVADRTNKRIQVFTEDGKFVTKWTDVGSPWGLIYSKSENCLFMCDGVNNRVVKLDLEGAVLGVLGSYGKIQGRFDFAHNIAVDSTGAIYVVEIKNWRVQKFMPR